MRDAPAAAPTIGSAVRDLSRRFRDAGIEMPALDARLLVCAAAGVDQSILIAEPSRLIDKATVAAVEASALRRLAREPVSRILGTRWFYGLEFLIGPATLDPRPDTETLVAGVLQRLSGDQARAVGGPVRILDLGTGSGAIIVTLLAHMPSATGVAVDCSADAVAMARRNAERHGVSDRCEFRVGNWLDGLTGRFDVIVSNPPYIEREVIRTLDPEVANHDPLAALDGGVDGLDAYRAILAAAPDHLTPHGLIVLEVGADQAEAVADICRQTARLEPEPDSSIWHDLSGHRRCVAIKLLL